MKRQKPKPFKAWMIYGWGKHGRPVPVIERVLFLRKEIALSYLINNRLDETWHPRRVEVKPL